MGRWVYRLRSSAAFVGLLFVALISLRAQGDETRLAISGYDPVAYFTDGKLYVMHSLAGRGNWLQNVSENIKRDNENWPSVKQQPEP